MLYLEYKRQKEREEMLCVKERQREREREEVMCVEEGQRYKQNERAGRRDANAGRAAERSLKRGRDTDGTENNIEVIER